MGLGAACDEISDLCGDSLGLGVVVLVGAVSDVRSPVALAGQAHCAVALGGAGEDVVGQGHDLRSGTVVARQFDDASTGVFASESRQIVRGRAREGVDRLCDVADDAHVVATTQPQVEEACLEEVDVLKLIDHEGSVLLAHDGGDVGAFLQHATQVDEDVLEVDDTAFVFRVLIHVEEACHVKCVQPGGYVSSQAFHARGVVRGVDHRDFRPFDLGGDVAHVRAVKRNAEAGGGGGDKGGFVRHDVGQGTAHDGGPEMAQLAQRRGVEGACLRLGNPQLGQAVSHLEGGALREGHGQHVGWVKSPDGSPVGDAVRDRPRFTCARAGQHGERAGHLRGDGALIGVQGVEQFLGVHAPHSSIARPQLRPAPAGPLGRSVPYQSARSA